MFDDGLYSIIAGKQVRFQASLCYLGQPVGYAELKPDGKWSVFINDLDVSTQSLSLLHRPVGQFIALGSALAALWEKRFDTVAELALA